jgi:hypothetical protein
MLPLQARPATQIKTQDIWSAADKAFELVPIGMRVVAFGLLAWLLIRAVKGWKQLTIVELSAIAVAFSLAGR